MAFCFQFRENNARLEGFGFLKFYEGIRNNDDHISNRNFTRGQFR